MKHIKLQFIDLKIPMSALVFVVERCQGARVARVMWIQMSALEMVNPNNYEINVACI